MYVYDENIAFKITNIIFLEFIFDLLFFSIINIFTIYVKSNFFLIEKVFFNH